MRRDLTRWLPSTTVGTEFGHITKSKFQPPTSLAKGNLPAADVRFSDESINIVEVKDCLKVALGGSMLGSLHIILSSKDHSNCARVRLNQIRNHVNKRRIQWLNRRAFGICRNQHTVAELSGEESHSSNMHESLVRRPRDDHKNSNCRSVGLGL